VEEHEGVSWYSSSIAKELGVTSFTEFFVSYYWEHELKELRWRNISQTNTVDIRITSTYRILPRKPNMRRALTELGTVILKWVFENENIRC
jgi:hypothetical protein